MTNLMNSKPTTLRKSCSRSPSIGSQNGNSVGNEISTTANTSNQVSTGGASSIVMKDPKIFEKEMQAYGLKDKIQEISHMNNYIEENVYYKVSPEVSVSARCHSRTVS